MKTNEAKVMVITLDLTDTFTDHSLDEQSCKSIRQVGEQDNEI